LVFGGAGLVGGGGFEVEVDVNDGINSLSLFSISLFLQGFAFGAAHNCLHDNENNILTLPLVGGSVE
jgi:hypothetical protein